MRLIGFVPIIPVVAIVLALMVRASRRALEVDLRETNRSDPRHRSGDQPISVETGGVRRDGSGLPTSPS
jgi:hypothetical protein